MPTSTLNNTQLNFTTDGSTIAARMTASANTLTFVGDAAQFVTVDGIFVAEPTAGLEPANKNYVDSVAAGLTWKQPARVATTANGTLATDFEDGDTVDGVVLATGDRILLKDQTAGAENGVYTVNASGAPTRATDFDAPSEVNGAALLVLEGTTNADRAYVQTADVTTIGTDPMVFVQFGSVTPPGGSDTQVQYNNGGSFGGAAEWSITSSGANLNGTDSAVLNLGSGNDLVVSHNGTLGSINNVTGELDITTADTLDVNATNAVTIDSSSAAVTVTGQTGATVAATTGTAALNAVAAGATVTGQTGATVTATTGTLELTASAANVDINGTSTVTVDAGSTATITGGTGASLIATANNAVVTGATDAVITATAGTLDLNATAADVDIDAGTAVTVDAGSTVGITGATGVTVASTANDVDITAAGTLDMDATAGAVEINAGTTIDATGGTGVNVTATTGNAVVTSTAGTLDLNATAADVDIDAGTAVTVDAGSTINLTASSGVNLFKATSGAVGIAADGSADLFDAVTMATIANPATAFDATGGYENVVVLNNSQFITNAGLQEMEVKVNDVESNAILTVNTGQQPSMSAIGNGSTLTVTVPGLILSDAANGSWASGNIINIKGTTNYDNSYTIATITDDSTDTTITTVQSVTDEGNQNGYIRNDTSLATFTHAAVAIGKNTTSLTYILDVDGDARFTSVTNTSDRQFKNNIESITPAEGLALVNKLQPVRHDWKREEFPGHRFPVGRHIGFIAQEVQEHIPEVVKGDDELAVDYAKMVSVLTAAVQELSAQVADLQAQLAKQ